MTLLDWIVFIGILGFIVLFGLSFTKKAGKNMASFFLGGRNLPWYIAGISMVATTFAADTPLAVTELVADSGVSSNWLWWCFLAGGMLTTFFFANLWRRAEVLTEVELIELRYDGYAASFLRGFKSLYLGVFMNAVIIGWVNLALITLLQVFFGLDFFGAACYTALVMVIVAIYSSLSGFLGVAFTDAIQFVIAMVGCIILAILVVNSPEVGGMSKLQETLPEGAFSFFPQVGGEAASGSDLGSTLALGVGGFLAYVGVLWWASWYPGAEPGGGGYVAQRMMSAKDEKHAVYATLFFQIAHYCIRPWPWIVVGLCCISLYGMNYNLKYIPDQELVQNIQALKADKSEKGKQLINDKIFVLDAAQLEELAAKDSDQGKLVNKNLSQLKAVNQQLAALAKDNQEIDEALQYSGDTRKGFVLAMKGFLPSGLKGLLLVAFFAAYMSTMSTQLNWGASYVVNDFYHRFLDRSATQEKLVKVARIVTLLLMVIGLGVSLILDSIADGWKFIMECGAGLGLVLILRWYWWRINAWSEITATIAPFIAFSISKWVLGWEFPNSFFFTVGFTTVAWLVVTFFTPPTNIEKLKAFYTKVRPDGYWGAVSELTSLAGRKSNLPYLFLCWISAIVMTYSILFASGKFVFLEWMMGLMWLVVAVIAFFVLRMAVGKTEILKD